MIGISMLTISILLGFLGYCISFPFALLFVAVRLVTPIPIPVDVHAPILLLCPLPPFFYNTITVLAFIPWRFVEWSRWSTRTTSTTMATSCYRANFRSFILTQWCALKARWGWGLWPREDQLHS